MTGIPQHVRRQKWLVLATLAAVFTLGITSAYAQYQDQNVCTGGTVNYSDSGYDGGVSDAEDQTVCLTYDSQAGLDSYVETDNDYAADFYSEYGDDNMWTYGVGAEAQLVGFDADNNAYSVADSGMSYSGTDGSGAQSAVATIDSTQQQYPTYQLNGLWSECESGNGPYNCDWWASNPGLSVGMQFAPVLLTPTLSVSTSATPSTLGQSVTFTALASGQGAVPTGTISLLDSGTDIGDVSINSVYASNLVPYSQQFAASSWSGYCGPTSNMIVNTSDFPAPDGTNTATKFSEPATLLPCGASGVSLGILTFIPGGLQTGASYTVSTWLRGANGGENVYLGLNDCAESQVTLTTSWQRYSVVVPAISSGAASCEGGRGFQVLDLNSPNAIYYIWGAQTEQASSAGPYVMTGSSPQGGTDGAATLTTSALALGTHSITASYSGDANYGAAGSNAITQVVTGINYPPPQAGTIYRYMITPPSGPSGYAANGNLVSYTDSVMGPWTFGYDALNRLSSASGSQAVDGNSAYGWTYDSFGNRLSQTGNGGMDIVTQVDTSGSPHNQITGTNALGVSVGVSPGLPSFYDAAGDMVVDGINAYLYDAEGRICLVYTGANPGFVAYLYDASGRRVAEGTVGAATCDMATNGFTPTKWYILGPSGEPMTEMAISGRHGNLGAHQCSFAQRHGHLPE